MSGGIIKFSLHTGYPQQSISHQLYFTTLDFRSADSLRPVVKAQFALEQSRSNEMKHVPLPVNWN